jgi:hypothetical protein
MDEAIAALRRQSLPPDEIVMVEGVSPFSRALNEGASRVVTPFFVQVDADMILDPDCLHELRSKMKPGVGMVVGRLRDPIVGSTVGVKMFRTACFSSAHLPDTISADTDFRDRITAQGWKTTYVSADEDRTVGDHLPVYVPSYTWRKYLIEGGRLRYRGAIGGLRHRLGKLEVSTHGQAHLAVIGLAHGFFRVGDSDELIAGLAVRDAGQAESVMELLSRKGPPVADAATAALGGRLRDVFRRYIAMGQRVAGAGGQDSARATLDALRDAGSNWRFTVAKLAFAHGLLLRDSSDDLIAADEMILKRFLTRGVHTRSGALTRMAGALRYTISGLTGRRRWKW